MHKIIVFILVAVAIVGGVALYTRKPAEPMYDPIQARMLAAIPTSQLPTMDRVTSADAGELKEFTLTSFYEMVDGKPKPQFSVSELRVKKGNTVRLKITNTKGMHDFVIDELKVYKETPLDEEVVVEFTADKAGEFIYYCSKPNHRALGQWGTLVVEE